MPKTAQFSLRLLVPNKYPKLNTEVFACVCHQQLLLKKVVIDNMKDCTERYVNTVCKTHPTDEKKIVEFEEVELDSDMEDLIENFLFFKSKYSDKITTDIITSYVSYMLLNTDWYKCSVFFDNCMYKKKDNYVKQKVNEELLLIINSCIEHPIPNDLMKYGKLLTSQLVRTKYDCFDRDIEIEQCVNSLSRMKKNNIILVGEPGVGKTCIVGGICNYLQSDKCPKHLKNYCVFELDTNKLIGGTTYRGDLEKRLDALLDLLAKSKVIIFIDELHIIFNKTGSDGDSATLQNVLKPFLAENSIVIGCTTNSEYKIIERDKAFERRFSIIHINEPSKESVVKLLDKSKESYSNFHNIKIDSGSCIDVVNLCDSYIKNRYFPDKAFDVLDYACVLCKKDNKDILTKDYLEKSVYKVSGIDPSNRTVSDIFNIEDDIKHVVIGQDDAVRRICKCIKKYYAGVNDKTKPIGCFLFVGSTGVGKTELCKQIAKRCFTDESFIRFDMSEFMEQHSVAKLIGAPPGYVGHKTGGTLTEKIKHNPFSIILFDEIEKAHEDVINILLQIMDDGRLTDSFGNTVDFCNCLIVMTSNIGCKECLEKRSIGFSENTIDTSRIMNSVNNYFSPEFRNRLTDIILFNTITKESYIKIFDNKLSGYLSKYESVGKTITLSDTAREHLFDICYSEKDGVRYIDNKISSSLDDIILDNFDTSDNIVLDFNGDCFKVKELEVIKTT